MSMAFLPEEDAAGVPRARGDAPAPPRGEVPVGDGGRRGAGDVGGHDGGGCQVADARDVHARRGQRVQVRARPPVVQVPEETEPPCTQLGRGGVAGVYLHSTDIHHNFNFILSHR